MNQPEDKAPLLDHLIELRQRLMKSVFAILIGFIICFIFAEQIFQFLIHPLQVEMGPNTKLIYTGLHEAFFTYMKLAFFSGLFLALPVVITQIWLFIAPGLYQHEQKVFFPFIIITPVLFFAGGIFAYTVVFPFAFSFFLSFTTENIDAVPRVGEYLELVMTMIFAFGLTSEMPVLLIVLIRTGVISTASLINKRKYAIVGAFVVGGILTPPDPFSQIFLAIPLLAMYEISIFFGRMIDRDRAKEQEKAERQAAEEIDETMEDT